MNSDTILDYAQFQLSPRRTRCELFVSGASKSEKLASGFLKPFLTHLKVAEEQANQANQSIKLEIEKGKNAGTWFNKGTLERFVRFVSTPEVLESVNTFDAEMSQLEGARKIYSQGSGDQHSDKLGGSKSASAASADVTKKELLRAIDVRLIALQQDLATASARASAAGFTLDTVSELLLFADRFGALRLNEACTKFIALCQRRPALIRHQRPQPPVLPPHWKGFADGNIRSSSGSDMSIDEPEVETTGPFTAFTRGVSGGGPESSKPTCLQPSKKTTAKVQHSAHTLPEKDNSNVKEEPYPSVAPSNEPVQRAGGGSRRLSVQDRINLFESKQKEQSATASSSNSCSGGAGVNRVVSGKGEHRRLPSDVSIEKSVLRRWSGVSDMSIDLNSSFSGERKESDSVAGTPTSSANSLVLSRSKSEEQSGVLKDTATSWPRFGSKDNSTNTILSSSSQSQSKKLPKDEDQGVDDLTRESATTIYKAPSKLSSEKGHNDSLTQFESPVSGGHQDGSTDKSAARASIKPASQIWEAVSLQYRTASVSQLCGDTKQNVELDDEVASKISEVSAITMQAEPKDQAAENIVEVKSQATLVTRFRTSAGKTEDKGAKLKVLMYPQFQSKPSVDKESIAPQSDLPSQSQQKSYPGNQEDVGRKDTATYFNMPFTASLEDDSGLQGMNIHERRSDPEQIKEHGRKDEKVQPQRTTVTVFSVKNAKESFDMLQFPSKPTMQQAQVVRPSRGNNELNDELQMKADELEKLFAAHKLRVHGEQTASLRRSKTIDSQSVKSAETGPIEAPVDQLVEGNAPSKSLRNGMEFDSNLLMKMVDNLDSASSMKQKLGTLSPSDDLRGKLYEKYTQKRDAKLREEWGLKKAQKEAKMKALHDSLERSQAEMKAKFSRSADRKDSDHARRIAEKMRSCNVRSSIKNKGQTVELPGDEDDLQNIEQSFYGQDRWQNDTLSGNESSTSSKKLVSSKILSSSTPRTPAVPVPRQSAKASNSSSRRRTQPENPLAQSVPSFSDYRKENTKPVTGVSKVASRAQPRTFARSKSSTAEANNAREEKSDRYNSLRKNSTIPGELKDLSPLNSEDANFTPSKFSNMEQHINKGGDSKPFLRKGNIMCPGTGVGTAKLNASLNLDFFKDEVSEGRVDQQDDSLDMVKDNEAGFDRASTKGARGTTFPAESDSENCDRGSENGDMLRSLCRNVDCAVAASSNFNPSTGNVQESPGESPRSWNSNTHHSFSYANEASDVDAFVDSPTGSPASWNSHPMNQMIEADVARMRKKWGSAQVPVLVANAPHNSRKDVTKGFKRLLKFGRKSRGADYLVNDWVSASTASEGDDDTEDGRELGTRFSDDLRKSRMGYSIPAYDSFNEGDTFPEQVQSLRSSIPHAPANFKLREDHLSGSSLKAPRSFFSLSSFRSKGSEAKPR